MIWALLAVAHAGIDQVRMDVRPALEGVVRPGDWSYMRVNLENPGDALDVELRLVAPTGVTDPVPTRRSVNLGAGARKTVDLPWRYDRGLQAVVQLHHDGGIVRAQPVQVYPAHWWDVTTAIIGDDAMGLTALRTATSGPVPGRHPRFRRSRARDVHSALIFPEELPRNRVGLATLDWLVWPEARPDGVDAQQLEAVMHWVADGGHLLVTVSDQTRRLADSPLADALPVDVGDAQVRDLTWLDEVGGAPAGPVATLTPRSQARVLASADDGSAVWVAGPWGLGTVHVVGTDLRRLDGDREALWRKLLWLPKTHAPWSDHLLPLREAMDAVPPEWNCAWRTGEPRRVAERATRTWRQSAAVPLVEPVPYAWVFGLTGLYLLVIGPLELGVLTLAGRRAWTWVSFPAVATVFTAYVAHTTWQEADGVTVHRVSRVDVLPGTGLWRGHNVTGVFAPERGVVTVRPGTRDAWTTPLEDRGFMREVRLDASEGGALSWQSEAHTLAWVQSEWVAPVDGTLSLTRIEGGWRVTNTLPVDLYETRLQRQWDTWHIGALASGASIDIVGDPDSSGLGCVGANPDTRILCDLAQVSEIGHGHLHLPRDGVILGLTHQTPNADRVDWNGGVRGVQHTVVRVPVRLGGS